MARPQALLLFGSVLLLGAVLGTIAFFGDAILPVSTMIDGAEEDLPAEGTVFGEATITVPSARAILTRKAVLVIAHRGASHAAPENTLPAFRAGVDAGAELVELDYRHSLDGALIVLHDKTLDRTTDAVARWGGKDLAVAERSLAQLRTLDAGAWFGAGFVGTRVPTLAEAVDVIQPGAITLIERKTGTAAALVALLRAKDLVEHVVVQAFDWNFLADVSRAESRCVLVALGSKQLSPERLDRLAAIGVSAIGWNKRDITGALVQAAHGRGLKVWAYTVDQGERMRTLIALGVDGIITNRPADMRAALR